MITRELVKFRMHAYGSVGLGLGLVLGVRLVLMLATRGTRLPPTTLHTREAEANELEKRKQ